MTYFYLRVGPSADKAKIIISVSKKVSKKAVVRNRIRRRVRPVVSKLIGDLKPAIYFVVAKPGSQNLRGRELEQELAAIFKKS